MKCQKCSFQNPTDARFCENTLKKENAILMHKCPKCNAGFILGTKFRQKCECNLQFNGQIFNNYNNNHR
jgi:hypothetical protein